MIFYKIPYSSYKIKSKEYLHEYKKTYPWVIEKVFTLFPYYNYETKDFFLILRSLEVIHKFDFSKLYCTWCNSLLSIENFTKNPPITTCSEKCRNYAKWSAYRGVVGWSPWTKAAIEVLKSWKYYDKYSERWKKWANSPEFLLKIAQNKWFSEFDNFDNNFTPEVLDRLREIQGSVSSENRKSEIEKIKVITNFFNSLSAERKKVVLEYSLWEYINKSLSEFTELLSNNSDLLWKLYTIQKSIKTSLSEWSGLSSLWRRNPSKKLSFCRNRDTLAPRSWYEERFYQYLEKLWIYYSYENIRILLSTNNTYIVDFQIDNRLIELKWLVREDEIEKENLKIIEWMKYAKNNNLTYHLLFQSDLDYLSKINDRQEFLQYLDKHILINFGTLDDYKKELYFLNTNLIW